MKRVRITLHPTGDYAPPIYRLLAGGAAYLDRVQIVNWNVATPPTAFLFRLRGAYHRFETELASRDNVHEHELLPISERACYCYLKGEVTPAARTLFENFTRGSLITVPPIECNADGSNTFTLIGADADIQAAVGELPAAVNVTIDAVGGEQVAPDGVVGRLSDRQREAVELALAIGYYDVPREATTADVADELGCATATAAEHLQKAESAVFGSLFDGET